jgi:hypothetical protein
MPAARFARGLLAAVLVAALTATVGPWFARPGLAAESMRASNNVTAGALDGKAFTASIVRASVAEQSRELGDELMFSNGMFGSMLCRRFNFGDAPYWIRREGDQIHFLAEMTSPTDGKMVWKGTIRGDTLEGTMRWTKERWYWTIDTEHKIQGKLEKAPRGARPSAE